MHADRNRPDQTLTARTMPLLAVVIIGAAVRAAVTWQHLHHPLFKFLRLDEFEYNNWARQLLTGGFTLDYVPIHAPGYFYSLAFIYQVLGHDLLWPRLLNMACGIGSVILVHQITRRTFGAGAALVAALLIGLHWPLIVFEQRVLATSLYLMLILAALLATIIAAERERASWWAVAGAIAGLAILTRPTAGPWLMTVIAWLTLRAIQGRKPILMLHALVLMATALLIVSPAIIQNYRLGGEWFILQRNGGFNLYQGNNPDADGTPYVRPGGVWDAMTTMPINAGVQQASAQDRFYTRKLVEFARQRPASFLNLLGRKALLLVNRKEIRATLDPSFHRRQFSCLALPLPGYATIMCLALPGLLALRPLGRDRQLLLLFGAVNGATLIATMVASRYRVGFSAFAIVMAGAGAMTLVGATVSLRQWWTERGPFPWSSGALPLTLALLGLGLTFLPVANDYGDSEELAYLGDAYLGALDRPKANQSYYLALVENPDELNALMGLSWLAVLESDFETAEHYLRQAQEADPESAKVRYRLGGLYFRQGRLESAIVELEAAVERRPRLLTALYSLALVNAEAGDLDRARALLARIRELRPAFKPGERLLEMIGEEAGP